MNRYRNFRIAAQNNLKLGHVLISPEGGRYEIVKIYKKTWLRLILRYFRFKTKLYTFKGLYIGEVPPNETIICTYKKEKYEARV